MPRLTSISSVLHCLLNVYVLISLIVFISRQTCGGITYLTHFLILNLERKICGTDREDCHEFATCTDMGPGRYKCTCKKEYTGDGKTCIGLKKSRDS